MPSSPWSTDDLRRHAGGALVALHMFAVVVLALPTTEGLLTRKAWKEPSVQAEFAVWADVFRAVGLDYTVPELEEQLWAVATTYGRLHTQLKAPFALYEDYCGVRQHWQMFPAPQRRPAVLHIDVREGGRWVPVYRARSPEHAWNRRFFDQDRIRTLTFLYGWPHIRRRGKFKDFQDFLWPDLARDFPDASQGRIRLYRYATLSPSEVRAGERPKGRYEAGRTVSLEEYR